MSTFLRMLVCALVCCVGSRAFAQGVVDTCLVVTGTGSDIADLTKLVRTELERHPTFRESKDECRVQLVVERLDVDGQVFLTGRMSAQVPHRVLVQQKRFDLAVTELLTVVLGQDPLTLLDPRRADSVFRATQAPMRRAQPMWGAALGQTFLRMPDAVSNMSLLSLSYHRELDVWQVGVHLDTGLWLAPHPSSLHPTFSMAVIPELTRFTSARANTAGFASLGIGLMHQRFAGPSREEQTARRHTFDTGPVASLRFGVELLRSAQARARVYVEGLLPAFVSADARRDVIDAWVPSLTVGAGVVL